MARRRANRLGAWHFWYLAAPEHADRRRRPLRPECAETVEAGFLEFALRFACLAAQAAASTVNPVEASMPSSFSRMSIRCCRLGPPRRSPTLAISRSRLIVLVSAVLSGSDRSSCYVWTLVASAAQCGAWRVE